MTRALGQASRFRRPALSRGRRIARSRRHAPDPARASIALLAVALLALAPAAPAKSPAAGKTPPRRRARPPRRPAELRQGQGAARARRKAAAKAVPRPAPRRPQGVRAQVGRRRARRRSAASPPSSAPRAPSRRPTPTSPPRTSCSRTSSTRRSSSTRARSRGRVRATRSSRGRGRARRRGRGRGRAERRRRAPADGAQRTLFLPRAREYCRPMKANVLVVANRTAASHDLIACLRERAERSPARFELLDPAHVPGRAGARRRAPEPRRRARALRRARAGGRRARSPRDSDPVIAVLEAYDPGRHDEVVVSTLPASASHWLRIDGPARIARVDRRARAPRRVARRPAPRRRPSTSSSAPGPGRARAARRARLRRAPPDDRLIS